MGERLQDSLRPGARLGRYTLLERVGAGGMAEVFAARSEGAEGFSRLVAIKVVHAESSDEEHLLALIDEARVAAWLQHPGIVQVFELARHGDGLYMVMELLDGWPLDQLLKQARSRGVTASLEVVAELGGQILDALGYAHRARDEQGRALDLVHRDIKPSNLMVDAEGHLKVVDFGIARVSNLERRTATGVGKGTPSYMSPEQLYGQPVDPRSDLFAVGCVLFELATGERLFHADAFGPLILRRQEGFTEADRERLQGCAPELVPAIARAVAQDKEDRWSDAPAFAAALSAACPHPAREATRSWLAAAWGGDPEERRRRVAGVDPALSATTPAWEGATAVAGSSILTAGTVAVPDATRLVPPRSRSGWARWAPATLMLGLVGLAGWALLRRPPQGDRPIEEPPVVVTLQDEEAPPPAPELPPASPSAEPVEVAKPTPTLPPEAKAAVSAPPPAPTPAPDPEPTEDPAGGPAGSARGELIVTLLPRSGFVEVDQGARWPTPGGRRLTAGVHTVSLLDREGGLLGAPRVKVQSGGTHRCTWRLNGGQLELQPSPFPDDRCELVP